MLGLLSRTSEEWVQAANEDPASVLRDHAHCEKKAASMAIALLNRYPEKSELVLQMAELAQEEMSHFQMVVEQMQERGIQLTRDPGDWYAQQLHEHIRKSEPERLLDSLLVSSLIEARSCERFQLLAESATDPDLRQFYRSLLESEARHRTQFVKLANLYFASSVVRMRLDQLEEHEAAIVANLGAQATMHG